jgi:hypothetical protein
VSSVGGLPRDSNLTAHYSSIEQGLNVNWNANYAGLVVGQGNETEPIHRWFTIKESYSSQLLGRVIKDSTLSGRRSLRVLDPFAGVGTTLVSTGNMMVEGNLASASVAGIEANPFLHLVAQSKVSSLQGPHPPFLKFVRKMAANVRSGKVQSPLVPDSSTLRNERFFDSSDVIHLLSLAAAISAEEEAGASPLEIALGRLCVGACVEAVSSLRRDGRALRYVEKRIRPEAIAAFLQKADQVDRDLGAGPLPLRGSVRMGDARDARLWATLDDEFDLILYSPPYPNNIDYTEVYKLESWVLGFIASIEGFRAQRLRTVYSHPSLLRADPLPSPALSMAENEWVLGSVEPIVHAVPDDRYQMGRVRMLRGYALDMFLTLREARGKLAPDGQLVYVVGNSLHGKPPSHFVVAADLLMARLATGAGLVVDRLELARHLQRRGVGSPYLRESLGFLSLA